MHRCGISFLLREKICCDESYHNEFKLNLHTYLVMRHTNTHGNDKKIIFKSKIKPCL